PPPDELSQVTTGGRLRVSDCGAARKRPPCVPRLHAGPQCAVGATSLLQHADEQLYDIDSRPHGSESRAHPVLLEDSLERICPGVRLRSGTLESQPGLRGTQTTEPYQCSRADSRSGARFLATYSSGSPLNR